MRDPWVIIEQYPQLEIRTERLPGITACTDGVATIWLDDRLTQTERRCAVAHELVHLHHGHTGHQSARIERMVRERVARWLVPLEDLAVFRGGELSLWSVAEDLGVTVDVLRDRLDTASAAERAVLCGDFEI